MAPKLIKAMANRVLRLLYLAWNGIIKVLTVGTNKIKVMRISGDGLVFQVLQVATILIHSSKDKRGLTGSIN